MTSLCSEVNIYLFLYPKEVFQILKKERKIKKKASAKQKRAAQKRKKIRSVVARFYQACELSRFYQG
jgi:hypothetical protein